MKEERIAAAVVACLHHATRNSDSSRGVRDFIDELSQREWSREEIEEIRRRALRVLALLEAKPR